MPNILRQAAARTLTDTTSLQKLFDTNTTGALDLVPGFYAFEAAFSITAMSATSGNLQMDLLGAGTATLAKLLWQGAGADQNTMEVTGALSASMMNSKDSGASMTTAATGTTEQAILRGTFDCTVAGTIIPSIALVTGGVTPQVEVGSYFSVTRIGAEGQGIYIDGYRTTLSDVTVGLTRTITYNDGTVRVDKL